MIHLAMRAVSEDLNAFFRRRKGDGQDRIVLSSLTDPQGALPAGADDRIVFLVVRIAEEKNAGTGLGFNAPPSQHPRLREPVYLNLHVMFAAMYRQYETGLEGIAEVIAYLHGKPIYTPQNTPAMNPALGTLNLKMESLDYAQQGHLWASSGAKYVPSVVYSLRVLAADEEQIEAIEPTVS